jgi:hypothetical protein
VLPPLGNWTSADAIAEILAKARTCFTANFCGGILSDSHFVGFQCGAKRASSFFAAFFSGNAELGLSLN